MPRPLARAAALVLSLLPLGATAETHRIQIADNAFSPAILTVAAGDTLRVLNADDVPHTFTATDGTFDSGRLMHGDATQLVLAAAGAHDFRCALGGQRVRVLVEVGRGAVHHGRAASQQAAFHRSGR